MAVVRREISDRSFFGKLVKWLFILFNVIMIFALFQGCSATNDVIMNATSDAERAGAGIGATLGVGMLLMFWVMGDIIIGTVVLLTRRKKIVETNE